MPASRQVTRWERLYPYPQFGPLALPGRHRGHQIRLAASQSHQARIAQSPGRWQLHLGTRLPTPRASGLFQSGGIRWQLQNIPPHVLNFNDLYGTESQLPAEIRQRAHQRLAVGMVLELPERHVSDAAHQHHRELPDQPGYPGSGATSVHGRRGYQRSQHLQSVFHAGAESECMAAVSD